MRIAQAFIVTIILLPTIANAVTMELVSSKNTVSIGEMLRVDIVIADFTPGISPPIGDFDIQIGFDPTALYSDIQSLPTDTIFSSYLGSPGHQTTAVWGAYMSTGIATVSEWSILPSEELFLLQQVESFSLASLFFTARSLGSTPILFNFVSIGGAGLWMTDLGYQAPGARLDISIGNSININVGIIPLPATAWLFASSLIGLGAVARKRKYCY